VLVEFLISFRCENETTGSIDAKIFFEFNFNQVGSIYDLRKWDINSIFQNLSNDWELNFFLNDFWLIDVTSE